MRPELVELFLHLRHHRLADALHELSQFTPQTTTEHSVKLKPEASDEEESVSPTAYKWRCDALQNFLSATLRAQERLVCDGTNRSDGSTDGVAFARRYEQLQLAFSRHDAALLDAVLV
ncbi:MAG: hypothetical protein MHM6MM_003285 [Cercozoa sp. M6MM]